MPYTRKTMKPAKAKYRKKGGKYATKRMGAKPKMNPGY